MPGCIDLWYGHRTQEKPPSFISGMSITGNVHFVYLMSIKHHQIPSVALAALLEFYTATSIFKKPENVKIPTAGGPPVQLIADPSDGFACTASTDCTYLVKDLQTMQQHGREKHDTTCLMTIQYRPCQVQCIFTAVGNSHFEIGQNVMPGASPDIKSTLQTMFIPTLDVTLVVPANTEQERTLLM
jgi:hypothetical protein